MKNEMIWAYMLYLSDHMWVDESSRAMDWYQSSKPYCEEISTEVEAWDKIVSFLGERKFNMVLIDVGDGIKYDSHPEISAPNAWEKDFLKKKLDELRALGIEPIPKLNFSTGHDTWTKKFRRMISTPEYYTFCADLIREVCEVFDYPRFFHLGFDEEDAAHQLNYEMIIIRNSDLWWHDLYFLCKECEKHGARPWIWSDYCWSNEELFLKNMPKSVLQSNWYYHEFRTWPAEAQKGAKWNHAIATYELLDKHGFDQIPTGSTWGCSANLYETVAHGKEKLSPEHLLGFMSAPWLRSNEADFYGHCNDADRFFQARKKLYPETL